MITDELERIVKEKTGAHGIRGMESVQSLWSGYGQILRVSLDTVGSHDSVIVKCVEPPSDGSHPRGWSGDRSNERKLASYRIEQCFYETYAKKLRRDGPGRVPRGIYLEATESGWLFLLEDLDAEGFDLRLRNLETSRLHACLDWLATFHATFLDVEPEGLWSEGTYWHLATRPDELSVMPEGPLKSAAPALDERLRSARYRTLVHGDAKVANFCFPQDATKGVAAVDFQYVGGGVGIKDVAYFFSSCLSESECEAEAPALLDHYFTQLGQALVERGVEDVHEVEQEWRSLYPIAWADFLRFLAGWAPGHEKVHGYSRRLTEQALSSL